MWCISSPTLEGTIAKTHYADLSAAVAHIYGPSTLEVMPRVIATLACGGTLIAGACGKVYTLSKATEQEYYS